MHPKAKINYCEDKMKARIERAKDIFMKYCGNRYFMDLDGVRSEYDWYQVP